MLKESQYGPLKEKVHLIDACLIVLFYETKKHSSLLRKKSKKFKYDILQAP